MERMLFMMELQEHAFHAAVGTSYFLYTFFFFPIFYFFCTYRILLAERNFNPRRAKIKISKLMLSPLFLFVKVSKKEGSALCQKNQKSAMPEVTMKG